MTLEEGIQFCENESHRLSECAENGLIQIGKSLYAIKAMEYAQMAEWLKELKARRGENPL